MKKITFSLGFLFTLVFVFGATFKFLHLPVADILMLVGVTGNAVVFIPLLEFNQHDVKLFDAMKRILAALGIALIFWFELLRWPGAGEIVTLGAFLFGFGFLPFFFFKLYKKSLQGL
ncbi:MAG: hypothetical protein ABJF04_13285 [Reichenbachiella sp.]|uniref:hypothetical protein n=1 Tax=Reichenbachiella sp. TaxID=2184521 RepID=UPI003264DD23